MRIPQGKSLALIVISSVLLVGLILTLYYVRIQQEGRSRATAATTLSLSPSTQQKSITDPVSFDIMINPGTNVVTFVQLEINYDSTKLGPLGTTPVFQTDTTTFPSVVEGPVYSSGKVGVVVSVGNDITKAIRAPSRVGTLTFQALSAASPTQVTFGPQTLVTSIGSGDGFSENVLSSTQPGLVTIVSNVSPTVTPTITPTPILPSATPTRTPTPTPTRTPTPLPSSTPTSIPPSPTPTRTPTPLPSSTPTRVPTATPTRTPTPIPPTPTSALSTKLALSLTLHGIGAGGDNVRPTDSSGSNKTPLHTNRQVSVLVYDTSNTLVKNIISTASFNGSGIFTGTTDLGTDLPTGKYYIKVKTDQFLRRLIPGFITITGGATTQLPNATLVSGDVNNDNRLDILDYNMILGCYSKFEPAKSCTADQKLATDVTDDGNVNDADNNLFIRELSVQSGD